jgi:dihydrodipicolinate synthase/N-acetylneuraminate lyase
MSYAPDELHGVQWMMPAFATPDAGGIFAAHTVDVENLQEGIDKIIKDGVHQIATTGSFGQCWNLFPDEFETLVRATIEAVDKRVPVFLGVTSTNLREAAQKMQFVREAGGEGVLLGLPYYNPLPVSQIPGFYRTFAEAFPDLSIMVYHNPLNHRVHIPVPAFEELVKLPNVVAMKDSHRDPLELMKLHDIIHGKIAHFVNQTQLYPYYELGASGCWSIDVGMGPWPILRLYQAVRERDVETAKRITNELTPGSTGRRAERLPADGEGGGVNIQELTGYIKPGPARPPSFSTGNGPSDAALKRTQQRAQRWLDLCEQYRPEVEAARAAGVI